MEVDQPPITVAVGRLVYGVTYAVGGAVHLFFWWNDSDVYAEITPYIRYDWYRSLWTGYVLPNVDVLLPLLAGFELLLAGLVLSRGQTARLGHGVGAAFQIALTPLGFWWPANVVIAAGHVLLVRYRFQVGPITDLRRRLRRSA
jgi:hypothetical protein